VTCVRLHPEAGVPTGASSVFGPDALKSLLPQSDVVVLAAPLTDRTNHLLGGSELASLPEGALVVNVARAGLIDHGALREALDAGRLGGAWLDVLPEEPLPPESALWDVPGLTISTHNAVAMGSYPVNLGRQCGRAVSAWLEGRPIDHVVLEVPPLPEKLAKRTTCGLGGRAGRPGPGYGQPPSHPASHPASQPAASSAYRVTCPIVSAAT
jgi:phosphoglycerate dehydrogenase-like enzyme